MKVKCCVSGSNKRRMEGGAGPFLLLGTEQTHKSHNPATVVMLSLAESVTAGWHPPSFHPNHHHHHTYIISSHCPHRPTPPPVGGQPIEGNRKERGLSLLFHPRNCQASASPQLATDPFLPACLRHTLAVSMFGTKVWWVEGEKEGVARDLSSAVPKPAKIKRLKLSQSGFGNKCTEKTVTEHNQRNASLVSKY